MVFSFITVALILFVNFLQLTKGNDHFSYKCEPGQIAAVFDRGPEFIKIQCAPLTVCGENKGCSSTPSCTGKGTYMCGVDESVSESVQTNCCNYGAPMQKHKSDDCQTFELYDPYDPYSDSPNSPNSPMLNGPAPLGPDGKPLSPNGHNPNSGGGGGGPPAVGAGGGPGGKGPHPKKDPNHKLHLTLYEVTAPVNPTEIVKSVQKIPNGYRVTVCKIRCQNNESTTTSTTRRTFPTKPQSKNGRPPMMPMVPINGNVPSNDFPKPQGPPSNPAPSSPQATPGTCTTDGQAFLNQLASGSSGSASSAGIPGYTTPGNYCAGTTDVGCLSECLRILQTRYKEAYCLVNNTCICKQTNDTANFAQRLMQQGLVTPPPSCCKQVSPQNAKMIDQIQKGKKVENSVPPTRKPGTFCKGGADNGCFTQCLGILKNLFKSATCEPSNSNCVCRQDSKPQNFEKNLKEAGVDPANPSCDKPKQQKDGKSGKPPPFIPYVPISPIPEGLQSPPSGGLPQHNCPEIIVKPPGDGGSSDPSKGSGEKGNQGGSKPSSHQKSNENSGKNPQKGHSGGMPMPLPIPMPEKPTSGSHGPSKGGHGTDDHDHGSNKNGQPSHNLPSHGLPNGGHGNSKSNENKHPNDHGMPNKNGQPSHLPSHALPNGGHGNSKSNENKHANGHGTPSKNAHQPGHSNEKLANGGNSKSSDHKSPSRIMPHGAGHDKSKSVSKEHGPHQNPQNHDPQHKGPNHENKTPSHDNKVPKHHGSHSKETQHGHPAPTGGKGNSPEHKNNRKVPSHKGPEHSKEHPTDKGHHYGQLKPSGFGSVQQKHEKPTQNTGKSNENQSGGLVVLPGRK